MRRVWGCRIVRVVADGLHGRARYITPAVRSRRRSRKRARRQIQDGWRLDAREPQRCAGARQVVGRSSAIRELDALEEQVTPNQDLKASRGSFRAGARPDPRYSVPPNFPNVSAGPSAPPAQFRQSALFHRFPTRRPWAISVAARPVLRDRSLGQHPPHRQGGAGGGAGDGGRSLDGEPQPACRAGARLYRSAQPGCPAAAPERYGESLRRCAAARPRIGMSAVARRNPMSHRRRPSSIRRRCRTPTCRVARAQYEHAIAVLIGKPPAAFTLPPASFGRSSRRRSRRFAVRIVAAPAGHRRSRAPCRRGQRADRYRRCGLYPT